MALPALPPLLTSAMETAPPLADALATPPFPADAMSCMMVSPPCSLPMRGRVRPPSVDPQNDCPRSKPHPTLSLGPKSIKSQASPLRHRTPHIPTGATLCATASTPRPCLPYPGPDGSRERRGRCYPFRPRRFCALNGSNAGVTPASRPPFANVDVEPHVPAIAPAIAHYLERRVEEVTVWHAGTWHDAPRPTSGSAW